MADVGVIGLTNLENGVLTIGDLWDARLSKRVGFNLFGKKIDKKTSEPEPIIAVNPKSRPTTYKFSQIRDSKSAANQVDLGAEMTCQLLGGLISITGGFQFGLGWNSSTSTEEISLIVDNAINDVELRQYDLIQYRNYYDERVDQLLTEGKLSATHVVTMIEVGGRLSSSIKVTQKRKGNNFSLGIDVAKNVSLGPMALKIGFNVKVGEDVEVTNFEQKIELNSVPPIPPPKDIADFVGPDPRYVPADGDTTDQNDMENATVGSNFFKQIQGEQHFPHWDSTLVGIPIRFTLKPIDQIWQEKKDPDPGTDPETNTEDPEKTKTNGKFYAYKNFHKMSDNYSSNMEILQIQLELLRDFMSNDYLRREVLFAFTRSLAILSEEKHEITEQIAGKQRELEIWANDERLKILTCYVKYKKAYWSLPKPSDFPVTEREFECELGELESKVKDWMENKLLELIEGWKEGIKDEIKALNFFPPFDEELEDAPGEFTSPTIFFTNQTEVDAWIQSQRFGKLLYRTPKNPSEDLKKIPGEIFKIGPNLGALNIQAGLTYPSLIEGDDNDDNIFVLSTATRSLALQDYSSINEVLGLLSSLMSTNRSESDGSSPERRTNAEHLYTTYCEIHGLKLKNVDTDDIIPLLNLLRNDLANLKIIPTKTETILYLKERGFTWVFPIEGVQSIRHVVHSIMDLETNLEMNRQDVLCGVFFENRLLASPDTPIVFAADADQLTLACLDRLDFILLMHVFRDTSKAKELLDIRKIDKGRPELCSKLRKDYVLRYFGSNDESKGHTTHLLDVVTAAIQAPIDNPIVLANAFARYTITILGDLYSTYDFSEHWSDEFGQFHNGNIMGEVIKELDIFWSKKLPVYNDYVIPSNMHMTLQSIAADTDVTEDDDDNEDKPKNPLQLYDIVMKPHNDISDPFKWSEEFTNDINKLKSSTWFSSMQMNACAKLFSSLVEKESGLEEYKDEKIQCFNILKKIIQELQNKQAVSARTILEVMSFVVKKELPELSDDDSDGVLKSKCRFSPHFLPGIRSDESKYPYPAEIVYRIQNHFLLGRYYHMLSEIVENTEENFEHKNICKFQLEMNRLSNIEDRINLIRLIQEMKKFAQDALRLIWQNSRFQYLIKYYIVEPNEPNKFVLRALAKAFLSELHTLPQYIPSEIAKIILRYNLSSNGDPVGFQPAWNTAAVLLNSFQVLWVHDSMIETYPPIPEKFQIYLMRNSLKVDSVIYRELDFDGPAGLEKFYWNKDAKVFEQVWDIYTVREAISYLMEKKRKLISGSKNVAWTTIKSTTHNKPMTNKPTSNKPKTKISKVSPIREIGSLPAYLEMRNKLELAEDSLESLLYHIKLSQMQRTTIDKNPFEFTARVDTFTALLSQSEPTLQKEMLQILRSKFPNYALPLMITGTGGGSTGPINFGEFHLKKYEELPKIITFVRIGEHAMGKSQLLNKIFASEPEDTSTEEASIFASKAKSPAVPPTYLNGHAELLELTRKSKLVEDMGVEPFILVNLHGDAVKLPEHLQLLQNITSCFVMCWMPDIGSWTEIKNKEKLFRSLIKPNHAIVNLYIDPEEDILKEIELEQIIRTPFQDIETKKHLIMAIEKAITRLPRQPHGLEFLGSSSYDTKVLDFVDWLKRKGMAQVKGSLKLQQGRGLKNLDFLQDHWEKDIIYSELVGKFIDLLTATDEHGTKILYDLAELLVNEQSTKAYKDAWVNLNSMKNEDFGHTNFGSDKPHSLKRQVLLRNVQNKMDSSQLNFNNLLLEILRIRDLDSSKVDFPSIVELTANIFMESVPIPVPSIANVNFFQETWSTEFIDQLKPFGMNSVLVVNCVGTDASGISEVLDSLFGINFASSTNRGQWSDTPWSGIYMRFIHFSSAVQNETGVDGILLLYAKPFIPEANIGHTNFSNRDSQISTLLLSTSNLTLCFDYQSFTDILFSSAIALNKVKMKESIPEVFFIRLKDNQDFRNIKEDFKRVLAVLNDSSFPSEVSILGRKVIEQILSSLDDSSKTTLFDLFILTNNENEDPLSLIPLSEAIIKTAKDNSSHCPGLPEFLHELAPNWEFIRENINFPYPDFDDIEREKKFNQELFKFLDLIDKSYIYHTDNFPTFIFDGMASIVNAWVRNDPDKIDENTMKEELWTNITNFVDYMFEECRLGENEEACNECTKVQEAFTDAEEKWEDYIGKSDHFTLERLKEMMDRYMERERWHYTNLGNQLMSAFEARLLSEENGTYKVYPEEDPPLIELQHISLEKKIISSGRRLMQETDYVFGESAKKIDWNSNVTGDDYLTKTPAVENGLNERTLNSQEVGDIKPKLDKLIQKIIKEKGYTGIFQSGMVRYIATQVDDILNELKLSNMARMRKTKNLDEGVMKLLSSFRLVVKTTLIIRLRNRLEKAEEIWVKEHDPLNIFRGFKISTKD